MTRTGPDLRLRSGLGVRSLWVRSLEGERPFLLRSRDGERFRRAGLTERRRRCGEGVRRRRTGLGDRPLPRTTRGDRGRRFTDGDLAARLWSDIVRIRYI